MPNFRYSALTQAGERVTGEWAAVDAVAVIARLRDQALLPIAAVPVDGPGRAELKISWRRTGPLPGRDLALVTQQLARLLKAGLPLDRALSILVDLAESPRMNASLRRLLDQVREGTGLADGMARQGRRYPASFVTLVRAGEVSGALAAVLDQTAVFLGRSEAMRQTVISAMIYPIILIVVASLSIGLILVAVLPQFEPMFAEAGARLPAITRLVMAAGRGLRNDWWLLLTAVAGAAVAWSLAMRNPATVMMRDRVLLEAPLLRNLIRRFEIARFCRTLGVMLASGVAAPLALKLSGATIGNRVLAEAVAQTALRFKEGEGLSAPLSRAGYFPALAIQLIRIGEETGKLETMLNEVAEIYDQELQRLLQRLMAILVPGLTITMGLVVATIVAAVMTALISINALAG